MELEILKMGMMGSYVNFRQLEYAFFYRIRITPMYHIEEKYLDIFNLRNIVT